MIAYGGFLGLGAVPPGMPVGFATRGDLEVIRALVRMAVILHGFVEPSRGRPGHRARWLWHMRRIRQGMALEGLSGGLRRAARRRRVRKGGGSWRR